VTDATQIYAEAHLNDISEQAAKDAGKSAHEVYQDAIHASTILNIPLPREVELTRGGNPKLAGAAIESPAKMRRHLTMAVKSPERVATERRQVSGRLDMRNLVGLAIGAENVFRRRVEEEGREAAVSILIDVSGSMAGSRIAAAKAMALHMGDALKAAGVKFEITGFDDVCTVRPKSFAEGWAEPTRRKVAGLKTLSGTAMLPAMKACAERLVKQGNVTRRILLVLTDGQDSYAPEANAALCAFYAGRGVEIIGIGLQTSNLGPTFRGKAVHVWSTHELSTEGLKTLVKQLDAGAPRSA
jgi:Mg-chelatase subunit ChlD